MTSGCIGLVQSAHVKDFNVAFAAHLKRVTGCSLVLYVQGAESIKSHQRYLESGDVDAIVDFQLFAKFALNAPNSPDVFSRARQLEHEMGYSVNYLLMARREAGRGFAPGGLLHPRSPFNDMVSHSQLVHAVCEMIDFWRTEIASRNVTLILNGNKECAVACRLSGVNYRFMYATRYRNLYYWAVDEFVSPPGLGAVYEGLDDRIRPKISLSEPYAHETSTRKLFVGGNDIKRFIKFVKMVLFRYFYLRLKGYLPVTHPYLWESVRYHWRYWRDSSKLRFPLTKPLSSLQGIPFVFFPLQTEPEFSLQVMSPEYFNQLGAIASLARDLPAGTVLAVKETIWGLGRRPRDFYQQIKELTNVVLLDVEERGLDVVKKASAVATISGSAGIEAALQGCPVILFGRHNGYEFLPHVTLIKHEEELAKALSRIFEGEIDTQTSVVAGARYAEALEHVSFDFGDFAAFKPNSFTQKNVELAAEALISSVPDLLRPDTSRTNTTFELD